MAVVVGREWDRELMSWQLLEYGASFHLCHTNTLPRLSALMRLDFLTQEETVPCELIKKH